ncbi:hypothetical protein HYV82_01710 [Candidatus Woesearchaeota archaeon]|nr:hypothetical protein [Candidatus Woesearchaeota archaeon]
MGIVQDYNNRLEEAKSALAAGIEEGLEALINAGCKSFEISSSSELLAQIKDGKIVAILRRNHGWEDVAVADLGLRQKSLSYLLGLAQRLDNEPPKYASESEG